MMMVLMMMMMMRILDSVPFERVHLLSSPDYCLVSSGVVAAAAAASSRRVKVCCRCALRDARLCTAAAAIGAIVAAARGLGEQQERGRCSRALGRHSGARCSLSLAAAGPLSWLAFVRPAASAGPQTQREIQTCLQAKGMSVAADDARLRSRRSRTAASENFSFSSFAYTNEWTNCKHT